MKEFLNKTVLITGATGLIGSHLIDTMMKLDHVKVIALSRNKQKIIDGFQKYIGNSRFSYIVSDVSKSSAFDIETDVDYIFHAAGPMEGKIIANCPMDVIMPNLTGTVNCLELLRRQKEKSGNNGRLVLFSSVTVYANQTNQDRTVSEDQTDVTQGIDAVGAAYSQSKRMSEVIVQAYRKQYGIQAVIARLSTVYGNTRFLPDTAFFQFINAAVCHKNIIMKESGICRRDNIYIEDAIEGLLTICILGVDGQAYNISSNGELGNFAAVDEIALLIAKEFNDRFAYKGSSMISVLYQDSGNNARKPGLKLDNRKLKGLGWKLKTSLKDGIVQTVNDILAGQKERR